MVLSHTQFRGKGLNLSVWELTYLKVVEIKRAAFINEDAVSVKLDNDIPLIKYLLVDLTR